MIPDIDAGFKETCLNIFGRDIGDLEHYEKWLSSRVPLPIPAKSFLSGKEVWVPPPRMFIGTDFNKKRVIDHCEVNRLSTSFRSEDLDNLNLTKIKKIIDPVLYYMGNLRFGNTWNMEKCSGAGPGSNVYYSEEAYQGVNNLAYCNCVLASEYLYGCDNVPESSFCIKSYNSTKIKNCFEVDGCKNCVNSMFCHNCEDSTDCLFCFNVKGMQYCIGNTPLAKSDFFRIKNILISYITTSLLEKKSLAIDIFNLK